MTHRLVLPIAALAVGLLLIGCAGTTPVGPTPTAGAPTPAAADPTPASAPDDGDDGDDGDAPHQVPDLEAMLPSQVLGVAVNKASIKGDEAAEELSLSGTLLEAIELSGRSASEVEVAVGAPDDDSFLVMSLRVPGLDAAVLLDAIVAENDPTVFPVREGQIAGKEVTSVGESQFFYATGDILFSVFADVNAANEIISQLP